MAPVAGNRIFSQQRSRSRANVSVRGHYHFTWNQIPSRKQLTGEIGVYTRVPIQSIPSCVRVGCSDFPVKDRSVDETEATFFLGEKRDAKFNYDIRELLNM